MPLEPHHHSTPSLPPTQIDVPELPDVETAFYYRWRSYKKHIQYGSSPTWSGWVVTEFLPQVPWAGKFNTIPAAAGHHISEGRWIKNQTYINDYLQFWFRGGGNPRSYTSWIAWAAYKRYLVNGNASFITNLLPDLLTNLRGWKTSHFGSYGGRNCYYQDDGHDAMEVSISGSGCRPTINSVIFGEAVALIEIAKLASNASIVAEMTTLREEMRSVVLDQLWNEDSQSFAVIPLDRPSQPTPPPTPPPPPPAGFTQFNTGKFCCDQEKCKGGHSSFLYAGTVSSAACFAKCTSGPLADRCHFVTTHVGGETYCMVAEYCNTTNTFNPPAGTTTYARGKEETSPLLPAVEASTPGHAFCPGNGTAAWPKNETVTVRELLAFMPFYFSLSPDAAPANGNAGQLVGHGEQFAKYGAPMWPTLFDNMSFAAKWGLLSAERRSPCYNVRRV